MIATEPTFRALGLIFVISGTAGGLVATIHQILSRLRSTDSTAMGQVTFSLDRTSQEMVQLSVSEPAGSDSRVLRVGDAGQVTEMLLAELTHRAVGSRPQTLHLHAAGFVLDDALVVLSGRSGSGKSTLCAAAVQQGAVYLTDEVLAVGDGGEVTDALTRPIRLDALPPSSFGMEVDAYHAIGENVFVPFEHSWGAGTTLPSRRIVVALGDIGGPLRSWTPLRSAVLAHLIQNSFVPAARSQAGLEAGRAFVASSTVLALTGGGVIDRLTAIHQQLQDVKDR